MNPFTPGQLLDAAMAAFGLDPSAGVQLHAAATLLAARPAGLPAPGEAVAVASWVETQGRGAYVPPPVPFPLVPSAPALIYGPPNTAWPALAALLVTRYPANHPVQLLTLNTGGANPETSATTLFALSTLSALSALLYLPPLAVEAELRGLDGLRWVMTRLLGPGGCPWDVRQTHQSLRNALLEETHEVLEALDANDMAALSEELGDLLLAVLSHSEMARQNGSFTLEDVLHQSAAKLIRRHPHVFGTLKVEGEGAVLHNWEQIKAAELAAKGRSRASALDGVPPSLPALAAAQKLGAKAARAGFAWSDAAGCWAKLHEELGELQEAASSGEQAAIAEELGDVLFVVARLASYLEQDAEAALRAGNAKFRRRFGALEQHAAAEGRPLSALSLDELLALWAKGKQKSEYET